MSRGKVVDFGSTDVEHPLLSPEDAAFDDMPAAAGNAPDALARLASARARGRLAHAAILAGPAGAGKRWVAVRLAQLLACEAAPAGALAPCLRCNECLRTARGLDPGVVPLEPAWDSRRGQRKTEIAVEQVRELQSALGLRSDRRRVVIVDPADRMSHVAQEAILKTLEEPPAGVHLLLLTSRATFLKPTIRSRAPLLRVAPPSLEAVAATVVARRGMDASEAMLAARLAGGDLRVALAIDPAQAADEWLDLARSLYELLGPKGERKARDLATELVPAKGEDGGRDEIVRRLALLERVLRDALVAGAEAGAGALLHPGAEKAAASIAQRLPAASAARAFPLLEAARDDLALHVNAKVVLTHLLMEIRALRAPA